MDQRWAEIVRDYLEGLNRDGTEAVIERHLPRLCQQLQDLLETFPT